MCCFLCIKNDGFSVSAAILHRWIEHGTPEYMRNTFLIYCMLRIGSIKLKHPVFGNRTFFILTQVNSLLIWLCVLAIESAWSKYQRRQKSNNEIRFRITNQKPRTELWLHSIYCNVANKKKSELNRTWKIYVAKKQTACQIIRNWWQKTERAWQSLRFSSGQF